MDRYPNPNCFLPTKNEVAMVLKFTEELFTIMCKEFNIRKNELVEGDKE